MPNHSCSRSRTCWAQVPPGETPPAAACPPKVITGLDPPARRSFLHSELVRPGGQAAVHKLGVLKARALQDPLRLVAAQAHLAVRDDLFVAGRANVEKDDIFAGIQFGFDLLRVDAPSQAGALVADDVGRVRNGTCGSFEQNHSPLRRCEAGEFVVQVVERARVPLIPVVV